MDFINNEFLKCVLIAAFCVQTFAFSQTNHLRISAQKCSQYQRYVLKGNHSEKCLMNPLVSRGHQYEAFPHMATIYHNDWANEWNYLCTGALISDRFVLTVAACLWRPEPHFVRLGKNQKLAKSYEIEQTFRHPDYRMGWRYENNIGLIKLKQPVQFNKNVMPACLPQLPRNPRKAVYMEPSGSFFSYPSKSFKPVVYELFDGHKCYEKFVEREINSDMKQVVCVGGHSRCKGDIGEPLQTYGQDAKCMFSVVGVDKVCGIEFFSRVYPHLDWIESVVWRHL